MKAEIRFNDTCTDGKMLLREEIASCLVKYCQGCQANYVWRKASSKRIKKFTTEVLAVIGKRRVTYSDCGIFGRRFCCFPLCYYSWGCSRFRTEGGCKRKDSINVVFSVSYVDLESELTLAVCTSRVWWRAGMPLCNSSCNCQAFCVLAEHHTVADLACGLTLK